ncbi:hypothetical protein GCM10011321_20710 [Youhaiella tibetensis]|uniref:FAD-dependent oxidoreductase n=1 Tax=Paradevosia tibetensis TaxID=1447062 RepID=A0A5B9DN22_9HYPH|nr:FAD-dependent oxidoreductase [Youhaiella tibetensis]QEE19868.1 FAD-dependent oxidoreductase [Youhaiella tibetensis]GGF29178.1 hypothetical protein GCM10011321_20710 [Youhaiella tibetensis]
MKGQPNRVQSDAAPLAGTQIDRGAPLRFTLDGRVVNGFAGDTVLSALLASGIDTAGTHQGHAIALSERFAPAIAPAALAADPSRALPMQRTPARDGLEFRTVSGHPRRGFLGLLPRNDPSLGIRFDDPATRTVPWRDASPVSEMEADLVIVGGGVAGMSAAVAAGQSGSSVILIERRQNLGGSARLFGSVEDEEAPDVVIGRLAKALAHLANVTVLTMTEALAVSRPVVHAHQVQSSEGGLTPRRLAISSSRIILATGALDRLPVFSGNRLPGVVGLLEAFDRADRFGIRPGRRLALNTATNPAYRLAMLALDSEVAVAKMSDTRLRPQSRFIEFSKAYGIPLSSGLVPQSVGAHRHGGLEIHLSLEMENYARPEPAVIADQFVVSGGWQPALNLWLSAGGKARWRGDTAMLGADGQIDGMAIAGSVAGYRSLSGCAQSGIAAVATLFGRSAVPVFDIEIDPIYESPDAPASVVPARAEDEVAAYLDDGASLAERPRIERPLRLSLLSRNRRAPTLSESAHALSLGDLAADIALGLIPVSEASAVAAERCIDPAPLPQADAPPTRERETPYPHYLNERFGPEQAVWRVASDEPRHFEAGNLLYRNTDAADPLSACGVILGPSAEGQSGAIALVADGEADRRLVLRDTSRQVSVRLVEKL